MRYACGVHGDRTVTTATGRRLPARRPTEKSASRRRGWRMRCAASASPATSGSRPSCGTTPEHLTAYLAIPSMGAVLHTLNIRLSPEQIAFIANEAEDQVIIADLSLAGQLAPVLPMLETVHTVIAVGDGDIDALDGVRQDRAALRRRPCGGVARVRLAGDRRERPPPRCATPAAPPATRKALCTATVRAICTR